MLGPNLVCSTPRQRARPRPGTTGRTSAAARPILLATIAIVVIALLGAGCSGQDDEPTTAELLNELEGRALTPEELAQRNEIAQVLCRLDDQVLTTVWDDLSPRQLEFQDIVFSRECPSRLDLYRATTGRLGPGD